jgi:hypothetical protein
MATSLATDGVNAYILPHTPAVDLPRWMALLFSVIWIEQIVSANCSVSLTFLNYRDVQDRDVTFLGTCDSDGNWSKQVMN